MMGIHAMLMAEIHSVLFSDKMGLRAMLVVAIYAILYIVTMGINVQYYELLK
jgi:hypothetical protein